MQLSLISLATVKTQLGITASTYDSALSALLPIVSADIRRILHTRYDQYYECAFSAGDTTIDLLAYMYTTYNDIAYRTSLAAPMGLGRVLYSPSLAADTYLTAYNPATGLFTLSAAATGPGSYVYPTVSIAQWPAIAKMVWYKYSKQSTAHVDDMRGLSSYTVGVLSASYSDAEINKQYDYPQQLITDLGMPVASIG